MKTELIRIEIGLLALFPIIIPLFPLFDSQYARL
jgi:hypothetical protein